MNSTSISFMKGKQYIDQTRDKLQKGSRFITIKVRMLSRKQVFTLAASFAVLLVLIFWLTREKPAEPVYPVVQGETVLTRDMEIYGEYVGRIKAQQFVEIRARVEGYLENMLFEEGTHVKKGQVLFIIDPRTYRARADKAKSLLQKNKALQQKAERDLNRIRPLYEQNAASQLDLDNAIASYESAKAEVLMSEADLTQAEMALGYTTVRSPISGYISERNVDMGTLVGPGGKSLLATIVKSDTVNVTFSMTGLDYLKSKGTQCQLGTERHDPYLEPLHHHYLARQLGLSPERDGGLCRTASGPQYRYFLGTCRDAQSRPHPAAQTVYESEAVAGCARGCRHRTYEGIVHRRRRGTDICGA